MESPKLPIPLPVNGQEICEYADVPFGWFRIRYNGCILLAIYNALLLTGHGVGLMDIRKHLHHPLKPRFFGVRQWEVARCLRKLKIPHSSFSSAGELTAAMKPGDIAIVLSWNKSVPYCHFTMGEVPLSVVRFPSPFGGAHGVAVKRRHEGGWTVYNRYSNRSTPYEYRQFEDFLPFGALFIRGFLISPSSSNS